jgi:predicted enzyme related to lactoylglutathione lyase
MTDRAIVQSQVTFLYYDDLATATEFYERVLGLEMVEDQGWAKIFRTAGTAFVGLVDGKRGFRKPLADSAVLLTLAVNDTQVWYDHLIKHNVKILREPKESPEIQVRCFFIEDPGGYAIEIEQFLKPELQDVFHPAKG